MNGKVKSRFAAHEDFVTTVGKGLFREFVMEHFEMTDKDSQIDAGHLPTNVHMLHRQSREQIFHQTMDKLLEKLLVIFWVSNVVVYLIIII